jgi:hypothetical protein
VIFDPHQPFAALSAMVRVGAAGVAITSLEELVRRSDTGEGGMLDVEVQLSTRPWKRRVLAGVGAPGVRRIVVGSNALRFLAATAVAVAGSNLAVARAGVIAVAITSVVLRLECSLGTHASGSLATSTFVAAGLGLAAGSDRAMSFSLAFVAGLACLAYLVSGLRKLEQPEWRHGAAVGLNATTLVWGDRRVALLLRAHPALGRVLSWTTIAIECSVPLALLAPEPVSLALVGCAAALHLAIAFEMGLNCFLWTFGATYPAILYSAAWLHHAGL